MIARAYGQQRIQTLLRMAVPSQSNDVESLAKASLKFIWNRSVRHHMRGLVQR